jgi:murein DD-endopeptidase MepM/ murein hydrolase activator NlpD
VREERERAEREQTRRAEAAAEAEAARRRRQVESEARERAREAEIESRRSAQQAEAEAARAAQRRREEAEQASRERQLQAQRERRLTEERDKAKRATAKRERMRGDERDPAKPAPAAAAPPDGPPLTPTGRGPRRRPAPSVRPSGQRQGSGPHPVLTDTASLRRPTAMVGLALAVVTALAAGAGTLLGLPVPGLDDGDSGGSVAISQGDAALIALDSGTPAGLTKGPYFPIAGKADYGETDAKFGADRGGRLHEGQDLFAKPGTPLVSVRDGRVVDAGTINSPYSGGRGNWVVVYSPLDERSYVYLHLLKPPIVDKGEEVRAGQPLGQLGCTGSCFGPHLHFEVRRGEASFAAETKAVNPLPLLREWEQVPTPEP